MSPTPGTDAIERTAEKAKAQLPKVPMPPQPTWYETVQEALPAHAYISRHGHTWRADWSTPVGLWTVTRTAALVQTPQVKITGPWHNADFQDAPAGFVVTLLRTFGAIA